MQVWMIWNLITGEWRAKQDGPVCAYWTFQEDATVFTDKDKAKRILGQCRGTDEVRLMCFDLVEHQEEEAA